MQNAKTEKVANLQANKLRELSGHAKIDKASPDHVRRMRKSRSAAFFG
jgi:hypothetical protein